MLQVDSVAVIIYEALVGSGLIKLIRIPLLLTFRFINKIINILLIVFVANLISLNYCNTVNWLLPVNINNKSKIFISYFIKYLLRLINITLIYSYYVVNLSYEKNT